jgi:hypothetical protein
MYAAHPTSLQTPPSTRTTKAPLSDAPVGDSSMSSKAPGISGKGAMITSRSPKEKTGAPRRVEVKGQRPDLHGRLWTEPATVSTATGGADELVA